VLVGWLAKYLAFRPGLTIGFDVQGGLSSELESYGHLKNPLLRGLMRWIEAFVVARADVFFCSSEASVRLFSQEFGVDAHRLNLVPDGADVTADTERKTCPNPQGSSVAIYTGGLAESKGLSMLQAVIHEAAQRKLPIHFRIVGYPTEQLEEFIAAHELDNCTLLGRVPFEELSEHLHDAAVALEPKSAQSSEASGKLLNYMAAALPVVCFDTTNSRNIVGDSGYFVAPSTAAAFVDRLEQVINDPEGAKSRGRRARERLIKDFSWSASAGTIAATYAALLAASPRQRD
jgi:glycosyltransferase involved in cell wall biosynthesis